MSRVRKGRTLDETQKVTPYSVSVARCTCSGETPGDEHVPGCNWYVGPLEMAARAKVDATIASVEDARGLDCLNRASQIGEALEAKDDLDKAAEAIRELQQEELRDIMSRTNFKATLKRFKALEAAISNLVDAFYDVDELLDLENETPLSKAISGRNAATTFIDESMAAPIAEKQVCGTNTGPVAWAATPEVYEKIERELADSKLLDMLERLCRRWYEAACPTKIDDHFIIWESMVGPYRSIVCPDNDRVWDSNEVKHRLIDFIETNQREMMLAGYVLSQRAFVTENDPGDTPAERAFSRISGYAIERLPR